MAIHTSSKGALKYISAIQLANVALLYSVAEQEE